MGNSGKGLVSFRALTRSITLVGAACLATAFVACGGSNNPPAASGGSHAQSQSSPKKSSSGGGSTEQTSTKTIAGQQVNFKKSANVSNKSSVEIEAHDFYFSPTVLNGKPGQSITVELKNAGTVTHNFSLPSDHISKNLAVGATTTVKITFPKSGTVLFHCAFHQLSGMRGALQSS